MLRSLQVRNFAIVDEVEIDFRPHMTVLTGETGAGKSILLDALGLALGARADSGLVRHGAEQAVVSAVFEVPANHPAHAILAGQGLDDAAAGLVLRRIVAADGRSRAFVNDQPASVGLLREIGGTLVEIQGQFEPRGLIDPSTHRVLLDDFGGLQDAKAQVTEAYRAWREAARVREEAETDAADAERDREFLEHAVEELTQLDPAAGEETRLAEQRTRLMHAEKLVEAMNAAAAEIAGARPVEDALRAAQRALARAADKAGGALDGALAALDRAALETAEAQRELEAAAAERLSAGRREAAARLDDAVNAELPPLRLDKARFVTQLERQPEASWTSDGLDRIAFLVATNPGTPEGPLSKVASGGELSRIMLALKVAAAEPSGVPTLIFDEVDANIGGATADAVGERLARLARDVQVLVITHSPQVAARGTDHLRVEKAADGGASAVTRVRRLDAGERREEVARMLSGAAITDEARAQAARLIEGAAAS